MAVSLEVLSVALVVVLLGATMLAMMVGIVGGLFGERLERCSRCGRYGLTVGGQIHETACPVTWREHLAHLAHASLADVRLRHH